MNDRFDFAIVGAGIVGLAHAYHLAKAGKRVLVLERHAKAQGASVRNFGMVWPIGQPAGERYNLAARSRAIWLEVLTAAGLWHERCGTLQLSYSDDEAQVLREFAGDPRHQGRGYELVNAKHVAEVSPYVKTENLRLALFSPIETCVDPRQVIAELPAYLSGALGVQFEFNAAALGYEDGVLRSSRGNFRADQMVVCNGDEFQMLYPEWFAQSGIYRCKLQMMRSEPYASEPRIGPMLAAGLTQLHYTSFADCPSLPAVRKRIESQMPDYVRFGIHLLVSQTGRGEITIGDSHEYGDEIDIFSKEKIDDLILKYLAMFFTPPNLRVSQRWQGIYAKHPTEAWVQVRPAKGVTIVNGIGGNGMTLSFGLAERISQKLMEGLIN